MCGEIAWVKLRGFYCWWKDGFEVLLDWGSRSVFLRMRIRGLDFLRSYPGVSGWAAGLSALFWKGNCFCGTLVYVKLFSKSLLLSGAFMYIFPLLLLSLRFRLLSLWVSFRIYST